MPVESSLRVSDTDREAVASALADHYARGRLTLPELEDRAELAYRAGTRAELAAVTADLPAAVPRVMPAAAVRPGPGRPNFPAPTRRWSGLLVTAVICLVVWLATSVAQGGVSYFWPGWVVGPWAAALLLGGPGRFGVCASRR